MVKAEPKQPRDAEFHRHLCTACRWKPRAESHQCNPPPEKVRTVAYCDMRNRRIPK